MKDKPPYGAPCNHCGLCCQQAICRTGRLVLGDVHGACPALIEEGDGFLCGLMVRPHYAPVRTRIEGAERMRNAAKLLIGAGVGCCARAADEPKIESPERLTTVQRVAAYRVWGVLKAARVRDKAAAKQRARGANEDLAGTSGTQKYA
jgi:hypothetical protein